MNYVELKSRADGSAATSYPRVVVQVGGCSRSVGADSIVDHLRGEIAKHRLDLPVVVAGCDGACYQAPVVTVETEDGAMYRLTNVRSDDISNFVGDFVDGSPNPGLEWKDAWEGQSRLVLRNVGRISATDLDEYVALGGYSALDTVLSSMSPEQVIEKVMELDLKGRGGAYFPAAVKWRGARDTGRSPRYLIVNAEEGEPGIYKDRHIMEGDPYRLLEGVAIASYAIGAETAYMYINGEAHLSAKRVEQALAQAEAHSLIGDGILGTGFEFRIEVRRGAGGYVLGEESALMNSIEGQRNVPRTRPPFPVESGLWGQPTVINNVETLTNLPDIFQPARPEYPDLGTKASKGTKLISLSGRVQRPGLVEVAMGTTIGEIVNDVGGGPPEGRQVIGVVAGGPSGGLLPASMLDTPIGPGMLDESGAVLGSGGITVLDDTVSILDVVRRLAAYNANESCSKCTPCREGTKRMLDILDGLSEGRGKDSDLNDLDYLSDVVQFGSLCGLGQMAPGPIRSGLKHFGQAFGRQ